MSSSPVSSRLSLVIRSISRPAVVGIAAGAVAAIMLPVSAAHADPQ